MALRLTGRHNSCMIKKDVPTCELLYGEKAKARGTERRKEGIYMKLQI